jgi:hypothetical protein
MAAAILGAAALCLMSAACASATSEGPDSQARPAALSELPQKIEEGRQLDDQLGELMKRHEANQTIVAEVIAGRCTLLEAAAKFQDLNTRWPMARHWLEQRFPGVSYELALCRQIIEDARDELLRRAPDEVESVVSRLQAELADHLHRHRNICLPTVDW